MKEFIKRNSPVFIIGLVTLFIFVAIILLAQKNSVNGPELQKVQDDILVADHTPFTGYKEAPVVLVEFSDFGCPACKSFHPLVTELAEKNPDHLKVAWRHFPLPQHKNAKEASIAAQAANKQGKFWEYAEKLFDNQGSFERDDFLRYAEEVGLDVVTFETDYEDPVLQKQVNDDLRVASNLKINSTPSFFLNGEIMKFGSGADFENMVVNELSKHTEIVSDNSNSGLGNTDDDDTNEEGTDEEEGSTEDGEEASENEGTAENTEPADTIKEQFDAKYGVIQIVYTELGFDPNNLNAIQGQKVVFTNSTDEKMRLEQIIESYEQLKHPTTVMPGDTYEIRLTKDKLWTFKESDHRHYGSVFVLPPKDKSLIITE